MTSPKEKSLSSGPFSTEGKKSDLEKRTDCGGNLQESRNTGPICDGNSYYSLVDSLHYSKYLCFVVNTSQVEKTMSIVNLAYVPFPKLRGQIQTRFRYLLREF